MEFKVSERTNKLRKGDWILTKHGALIKTTGLEDTYVNSSMGDIPKKNILVILEELTTQTPKP